MTNVDGLDRFPLNVNFAILELPKCVK
jgi:hypothetical protein